MRMLLGVLADDPRTEDGESVGDVSATVVPQRSVGDLDALVASLRDTGRAITLAATRR